MKDHKVTTNILSVNYNEFVRGKGEENIED